MPKMKTKSSAKKRFKLTGSGKIKRRKAYLRHLANAKTKKQKTNLSKSDIIFKGDEPRVKRMLGLK